MYFNNSYFPKLNGLLSDNELNFSKPLVLYMDYLLSKNENIDYFFSNIPNKNIKIIDNYLEASIYYNCHLFTKEILSKKYEHKSYNCFITNAAYTNNIELVKLLINHSSVDSLVLNYVLCKYGSYSKDIMELLLNDKRSNPGFMDNYCILNNCNNKNIDGVKLLMKHKNVNPFANSNECLKIAVNVGSIELVKLLIKDTRFNFIINGYNIYIDAIKNGNLNIVELLIKTYNIDPSYNKNESIKVACEYNRINIIDYLLQDNRVDAHSSCETCIIYAIVNDNISLVKKLLDSNKNNNYSYKYIINKAVQYDRDNILKLIIEDGRSNDMITEAFYTSAEYSHVCLRILANYVSKSTLSYMVDKVYNRRCYMRPKIMAEIFKLNNIKCKLSKLKHPNQWSIDYFPLINELLISNTLEIKYNKLKHIYEGKFNSLVNLLLNNEDFDLNSYGNIIINDLYKYNYNKDLQNIKQLIKEILSNKKINVSYDNGIYIKIAATEQLWDIVKSMLNNSNANISSFLSYSLNKEATKEDIENYNESMQLVINGINSDKYDYKLFVENLIQYKHLNLFNILLNNKKIDPSINNNTIIKNSSQYGYLEIVKLLLNDKRVDPTADNNYSIRLASQNGHLEIVKLLLNDKRVDPSTNNNDAIEFASKNGHLEIVKLLLSDKRVDPSDNRNYAIRYASYNGHLEIVKLLLSDKRVDPSANNNDAIRFASYNGHLEIVKLLLSDERVDPSDNNNYAISYASKNGHLEIVKLLLNDKRVNPCINHNSIICDAVENNNIKLVEILLKHPKINPSANNNRPIKKAAEYGYIEIVKLLLEHKVNPFIDKKNALLNAILNDNLEIVRLFLKHPLIVYYNLNAILHRVNNEEIKKELNDFITLNK